MVWGYDFPCGGEACRRGLSLFGFLYPYYIYNTATPECGFQHMARGERLRKTLASTLALPPDLRQKVKKSFNGLNAESQTMRVRKCMVQLGNFHGSALRLPWLDFATSMVQLSEMHGSAFASPSIDKKFRS